jgi:maltose O-acetyltransferase
MNKFIQKLKDQGVWVIVRKASSILLKALKGVLNKIFQWPRLLKYRMLSSATITGARPTINQPVLFNGVGKIFCGNNVSFGVGPSPSFFSQYGYLEVRHTSAQISIGDDVAINNNCCFISNGAGITIGDYCCLGANVTVLDSDFHSLDPVARMNKKPGMDKAVIIGINVFIGNNVLILKGVTIGDNSVVAAGSVVSKDIPCNVIAAGNPCEIKRELDPVGS